jgi:hypothetical protein
MPESTTTGARKVCTTEASSFCMQPHFIEAYIDRESSIVSLGSEARECRGIKGDMYDQGNVH